ncbi:MAG: hypothetical protein JNJ90_18150 [Saprospiraceae bacterium]|jgi:hypothetical protein|nr:hypothetical protein [Saprospiraceae bacterium]
MLKDKFSLRYVPFEAPNFDFFAQLNIIRFGFPFAPPPKPHRKHGTMFAICLPAGTFPTLTKIPVSWATVPATAASLA